MCVTLAVLTILIQACLISATDVCAQQAKSDPTPNCNAIHLPGLHEIVPGGKPYTIRWDNNTGSSVSLVLCQGPSTDIQEIGCIVNHAPNNGLFVWTPATDLVPDGDHNYGLKIIANTGDFQWSDQFGISNSIISSSSTKAASSTQSKKRVQESATSIKGTAHSVKQDSGGQIQEPTGTVEIKKKTSSITIKNYTTSESKTQIKNPTHTENHTHTTIVTGQSLSPHPTHHESVDTSHTLTYQKSSHILSSVIGTPVTASVALIVPSTVQRTVPPTSRTTLPAPSPSTPVAPATSSISIFSGGAAALAAVTGVPLVFGAMAALVL
ncbi:Ser-Thr-rich glycosyl-phosphatidyl-inositol-anchored membrane family-domain-containing protein [Usnea florida]